MRHHHGPLHIPPQNRHPKQRPCLLSMGACQHSISGHMDRHPPIPSTLLCKSSRGHRLVPAVPSVLHKLHVTTNAPTGIRHRQHSHRCHHCCCRNRNKGIKRMEISQHMLQHTKDKATPVSPCAVTPTIGKLGGVVGSLTNRTFASSRRTKLNDKRSAQALTVSVCSCEKLFENPFSKSEVIINTHKSGKTDLVCFQRDSLVA
ncbi:hypothetical protein TRVL_10162 [Trypanosoma vivax]|nr:hypothetical protein TRVL_10162 [Trypanosoma vivax]